MSPLLVCADTSNQFSLQPYEHFCTRRGLKWKRRWSKKWKRRSNRNLRSIQGDLHEKMGVRPRTQFFVFFVLIFSWWIVATSRWAAIAALHPEWGNHRQKSTIHIWAFRLLKDIRRLAKSGVSSNLWSYRAFPHKVRCGMSWLCFPSA